LIPGVAFANRTAGERAEYRVVVVTRDAALLGGIVLDPYEDDDKVERRLSTPLWAWTDPKVDWPTYMRCNATAPNIGTQMWAVITNRYKLQTASEVGGHGRQL